MKLLLKIVFTLFVACLLANCNNRSANKAEQQSTAAQTLLSTDRLYTKVTERTITAENQALNAVSNGSEKQAHDCYDWRRGLYPSVFWQLYELTGDKKWKTASQKWSKSVEKTTMYNNFGNAFCLTSDKRYSNILIEAADSLIARFNPKVGCIRSTNHSNLSDSNNSFPVTIDNMASLELLYFATKVSGNKKYAKIATKHAETIAKYHICENYSTYHVVNFDNTTGSTLHKGAFRNYNDTTMRAIDQAWCIYGFTLVYRETKQRHFLELAQNVADSWLEQLNLPNNTINPYYTFSTSTTAHNKVKSKRDVLAATITSTALIELSTHLSDGAKYKESAFGILKSLNSPRYLTVGSTNNNFLLKYPIESISTDTVKNISPIYGDYYFLESLNRLINY